MNIHDILATMEADAAKIQSMKEKVRGIWAKKGIEFPDVLCRVVSDVAMDDDGYLLTNQSQMFPNDDYTRCFDPQSVPLVHPGDWEVVARYWQFPEYRESGKPFILLQLDAFGVEIVDYNPKISIFSHPEFFGKVQKSAIIQAEQYTWTKDLKPMNVPPRALEDKAVKASEGYSPMLLNDSQRL